MPKEVLNREQVEQLQEDRDELDRAVSLLCESENKLTTEAEGLERRIAYLEKREEILMECVNWYADEHLELVYGPGHVTAKQALAKLKEIEP